MNKLALWQKLKWDKRMLLISIVEKKKGLPESGSPFFGM